MTAELYAQISGLVKAEQLIQKALDQYREAVQNAKTAGDNVAAGWEGEARNAFVEEQEKAYQWHGQMMDVVKAFLKALAQTAEKYMELDQTLVRLIGSGG